MANVKKRQSVPPPQWWKHLRGYCKRQFWKRRADKNETRNPQR